MTPPGGPTLSTAKYCLPGQPVLEAEALHRTPLSHLFPEFVTELSANYHISVKIYRHHSLRFKGTDQEVLRRKGERNVWKSTVLLGSGIDSRTGHHRLRDECFSIQRRCLDIQQEPADAGEEIGRRMSPDPKH